MAIREDLIKQEGWERYPYKDSKGIWTIGVGHNMQEDKEMMMHFTKLQSEGLTDEQISELLTVDIQSKTNEVILRWPWVINLNEPRLEAMINLAFNMGTTRLSKFKRFLFAMQKERWEDAVKELLYTGENKTPYYITVGKRAEAVANQIKSA